MNLEVADHGDAETGDVVLVQDLLERERIVALPVGTLGSFDPGHRLGGGDLGSEKKRNESVHGGRVEAVHLRVKSYNGAKGDTTCYNC